MAKDRSCRFPILLALCEFDLFFCPQGLGLEYGAFLYPDLETAILGQFRQRVLLRGQGSRVIGEACQNGWIRDLSFELPKRDGTPYFKYGPPSHYSFGHGPELPDPYEDQKVKVRDTFEDEI